MPFSSKFAFFLSKVSSCTGEAWFLATDVDIDPVGHNFIHYCGDGSKLITDAVWVESEVINEYDGYIYITTNDGASWTPVRVVPENGNRIEMMASSDDGVRLSTIVSNGGFIYTSSDSGLNWTERKMPGDNNLPIEIRGARYWSGIASSSDGIKLVACATSKPIVGSVSSGEYIYTSSNGGVSWTQSTAPLCEWSSVASSTNGTNIVACCKFDLNWTTGRVYTSSDSGFSWIERPGAGRCFWEFVASSSDGSIIYAVGPTVPGDPRSPCNNCSIIVKSSNSGSSWSLVDLPFQGKITDISCSGNGQIILVCVDSLSTNPSDYYNKKNMWLSRDGGASWKSQCTAGSGHNVCCVNRAGGKAAAAISMFFGAPASPTAGVVKITTL